MPIFQLLYVTGTALDALWQQLWRFYRSENPARRWLMGSSLLFSLLFVLISLLIAWYMHRKGRLGRREARIRSLVYRVLEKALFESFDESSGDRHLSDTLRRLASRPRMRPLFSRQLCQARKDLKGEAGINLQRLYEEFGLDRDALRRLNSRHWQHRAAAIKELYLMDQRRCLPRIEPLTRHPNEYLRMEAQTCLLQFLGPEGLRFLDGLSLPVSEWQQIQLLGQLQEMHPERIPGLENYLGSPNPSVRRFALKLTGTFRQRDLLTRAGLMLRDRDPSVQREALRCLKHFYDEEVAQLLLESYRDLPQEGRREALELLGRQDHPRLLDFLRERLHDPEPELRLEAGRAFMRSLPEGLEALRLELAGDGLNGALLGQLQAESEEGRL